MSNYIILHSIILNFDYILFDNQSYFSQLLI